MLRFSASFPFALLWKSLVFIDILERRSRQLQLRGQ